jgi:hypothetical protein
LESSAQKILTLCVEERMKLAKLAVTFAIIFNTSYLVLAQSQPNTENGVKSFGSYTGSDIDTVNLQTAM